MRQQSDEVWALQDAEIKDVKMNTVDGGDMQGLGRETRAWNRRRCVKVSVVVKAKAKAGGGRGTAQVPEVWVAPVDHDGDGEPGNFGAGELTRSLTAVSGY